MKIPDQIHPFYKLMHERRNILTDIIFKLFMSFSSYPKLILEVFVRRQMGHRYFNTASFLSVLAILSFLPDWWHTLFASSRGWRHSQDQGEGFVLWYVFVIAYFVFGIMRVVEINRRLKARNYDIMTLSGGRSLDFFANLKVFGKYLTPPQIAIFAEPLPFFLGGLLLHLFGEHIGTVLMFCSICCAFAKAGEYKVGNDFFWDILDKIKYAKYLKNLTAGKPSKSGINLPLDPSITPEMRKDISDYITEEEDEMVAI